MGRIKGWIKIDDNRWMNKNNTDIVLIIHKHSGRYWLVTDDGENEIVIENAYRKQHIQRLATLYMKAYPRG